MSHENAKALYEKIMATPEIQAEILDALTRIRETGQTPDWEQLAASWGFGGISQQDVWGYGDSLMDDAYELSDFELEMVAAGTPEQSGNTGARTRTPLEPGLVLHSPYRPRIQSARSVRYGLVGADWPCVTGDWFAMASARALLGGKP